MKHQHLTQNRQVVRSVRWPLALACALALGNRAIATGEWTFEAPWPSSHNLKGIHMSGPDEAWIVGSPMLSNNTGHVLHTTDGGLTWERQVLTTSSISDIFFLDDQYGWIVGNNTWRTLDGGQTWTQVNNNGSLYGVFFLDAMRGWACGNGGVAYWTTNGGVNWHGVGPIGPWTLREIHFVDENNGWTIDIAGRIFHSTDGGLSWGEQLHDPQASFGSIQFFDSQEGWVIGGNRFYHTTDAGQNWQLFSDLPPGTWASDAHFAADRLTGVAAGADGNIIRTTDGGQTWTLVAPRRANTASISEISMVDGVHGFYAGERALLGRTDDGGQTWRQSGNTGWFMTHGMDALDDQHAWLACEAGEIMRTEDGGLHWERVFTPGIDKYGRVMDVSFVDLNEGYAVGKHEGFGEWDMKVLRSLDGGRSWAIRSVFNTPQDIKACDALAPGVVVVLGVNDVTGHGLNISHNGGLTWTGITPPGSGFIGNVDFVNPQVGWTAGSKIYKTINGGASWTLQAEPPTHMINISMFDEQYGWAVGAWGDILYTQDGGNSWIPQDAGTDEHLWGVSALSPFECWAAALVGIVFNTSDGGSTWSRERLVTESIINFETMDFSSPGNGWVAGNFGVWHYRDCGVAAYCEGLPNSVGSGAVIAGDGSTSIAANDFGLRATGCPSNKAGIFFYGSGQGNLPFGNGLRCVTGQPFRLPVLSTDSAGAAVQPIDYAYLPNEGQISAGDTWNFQFWYRDPMGGGAAFNTSDALRAIFCP